MAMKSINPDHNYSEMNDDIYVYVVTRDEELCTKCGGRGEQVHHIKFRSSGGGHCANNLALICRECHDLIHFGGLTKKDQNKITNTIRNQIGMNEKRLRRNLV
jgi:5-methylcytosine-specific restriction endonuclease McrA